MLSEKEQFDIYARELIEWNKKFNLTAIAEIEEIKKRHFDDSLSILQAIDLKDEKVVDIGPGAGFPGIPLKIVRPNIKLTLVEGTRKKSEFLTHIVKTLELKDVEVVWGRAEEINRNKIYSNQFDVALARAVAKLPALAAYALPFLKYGGIFIAQKQNEVEEEVKTAIGELNKLQGKLVEIKKVDVHGIVRSLVIIKRIVV
ncbi:16S rRNA (guanine(527)-N(7))-methyltransferase RsmG [Candidatus Saganbacteria bacterium]|nr:16S rRNA (guanine(527)-N(7))-methyltransferase RsmG [Candidatus Saganbacteria bacterium]